MARYTEPTPEQEKLWQKWLAERPDNVRKVAEKFDPWSLFRMKSSGHRVYVIGFDVGDTVTLRVAVTGAFNRVRFERQVFGIEPDDLEPCQLPGPDEPLGTELTQEEAWEQMDELRLEIRPDLWVRDERGKVVPRAH
jgi:hypothetical protein